MSSCSTCGRRIQFRTIDGVVRPLGCTCAGHSSRERSSSSEFDYVIRDEQENVSTDAGCWLTNCPHCRENVYFIRHNGGSVWLDPPLGSPWLKHRCFDFINDKDIQLSHHKATNARPTLIARVNKKEKGRKSSSKNDVSPFILGVVIITQFRVDMQRGSKTRCVLKTKSETLIEIYLDGNAKSTLGHLCLYHLKNQTVTVLSAPSKLYRVTNYDWNNIDLH